MKRLINLTSGYNVIDLSRVIDNITKFRISMFEFTGGTAVEKIHVKIDNHANNYDETNDLYYSLFFLSYASGNVTYTPSMISEGWNSISDGIHSMTIQLLIDCTLAGDVSSRNCFIEIEYV